VTVPFACLSGLLRVRLDHVRVADLVVKLERTADPVRLRDLLAETLADPTLTIGFWSDSADATGYFDADGRPVAVPEPGAGRAVTYVGEGERRLAVLIHDPALVEQRSLVQSAVAATRLALENARLHAVLRAQVAELRASRTRIAQAAVRERRKIERDLHDGVQQRLLRLSWLAKQAAASAGTGAVSTLDQLTEEVRVTHAELRELAQGIHPSAVTEHGLAVAIEEYALRAPLAVSVDIPAGRWPPEVEVTAYFVIVEAIVNAAKHAGAVEVQVSVRHRAGRLDVEVRDDGAGGAEPRRGTGLRGLRDRVSALGGTFTVDSPPGRGTVVRVELPCG
jgi:signal transduction histidine kinase